MTPYTVYTAGPMSLRPKMNFDAFDGVAARCRTYGMNVHNPAEHDRDVLGRAVIDDSDGWLRGDIDAYSLETGFDFSRELGWDFLRILESDGIVMLPEWETSTGARAERFVAEMTGKDVWIAFELENDLQPGTSHWHVTLDPEQVRLLGPTVRDDLVAA